MTNDDFNINIELYILNFDKLIKNRKIRYACEGRYIELFEILVFHLRGNDANGGFKTLYDAIKNGLGK